MITAVTMPDVGHAEAKATVVRWLAQEGDWVEMGAPLVEVETDKSLLTIEAFKSGFLRRLVAHKGKTVPTGGIIAWMSEGLDEPLPDMASEASTVVHDLAIDQQPIERLTEVARPMECKGLRVLPAARRLASEKRVDLSRVAGSGRGGVITEKDVARAIERSKTQGRMSKQRAPLSGRRRVIAERMAESKRNIPHFYVTIDVDMTEAERLRRQLNASISGEEVSVSPTDLVLRAVGMALVEFPVLNATYTAEGLLPHDEANVGIAVDTEGGVVVPVLRRADTKSLRQLARERAELVRGAREGRLSSSQLTGGTFTISNLGMLGVESFVAIVNPPEVGILAIGTITEQPTAVGGQVLLRSKAKMTLSVDHRVVDGALAARSLQRIRELLEAPSLL